MPYKYIEHEADVGIMGIGDTIEEAFEEGAKAMFNVMIDIDKIEAKQEIDVECKANDIASLFIEWLNELVLQRDIKNIFLSKFKVEKIKKVDDTYKLKGKAFGEPIDLKKHEVKIEVKAATYGGLKFEKKDNKYYVQCILDV